ncbi:MAG: hypothetical protein C5B59_16290 [Bacteroidetes bacterium]|nr:MAG: hypothetical protein C5B59_16290 [Bacteroidota bacterium]
MKTSIIIKSILYLTICTVFISSCSKKFLDLAPPSQIPQNEAIVDESSMKDAVAGMYASLRAVDFFGRTLPILGDLLADNIYIDPIQNSNRYLIDMTYTYTENYGNVASTWASAYNTILRANNVINANIPKSDIVDQLKGEALTIRALSYFELVKFFARPYTADPSAPNALGVPLVLTFDAKAKPARNSVGQVYNQIEQDLTAAYNLLNDQSKNSSYVTKYVAAGLLARMYQFKGDFANANNWALTVVNSGMYSLADSASLVTYWSNPFPVANGLETMFEVEFDNIGNNGTDNLDAFFSQAGYGDALCTDNLYGNYSITDARRALIVQDTRAGRGVLVVNKYPNTTNPNGKDNTKIMRYAEVLLILAESYNVLGDDASARQALNQLAQKRDPQFIGYSSSGDTLYNDIYRERRKELAFEGHRYWDFTRNNADVKRDNSTNNYGPTVPLILLASSPRRIYPIPRQELNANPNMVQNPGY